MKKASWALAALIAVGSAVAALAMPAKALDGQPKMEIGDDYGYFLWHDNDGAHLRWTTKGNKHVFSGTVRSGGGIEEIKGVKLEGPDWLVRTGPNGFKWSTTTES